MLAERASTRQRARGTREWLAIYSCFDRRFMVQSASLLGLFSCRCLHLAHRHGQARNNQDRSQATLVSALQLERCDAQ